MTLSLLAMRLASLVAILFSAAAAVDAFAWTPSFCGPASGCGAVRQSGLGQLVGDYLPPLGLSGFTFIFATTLVRQPPFPRLGRVAAVAAGMVGALLIAAQLLWLKALCLEELWPNQQDDRRSTLLPGPPCPGFGPPGLEPSFELDPRSPRTKTEPPAHGCWQWPGPRDRDPDLPSAVFRVLR